MIEVLAAGPMLSVQDGGRAGLRRFGVSGAGPIDAAALALANALCGNAPNAAGLEFAGPAGRFRSTGPTRFAVVGGDCRIRIGERLVPAGESHRLDPGEEVSVGAPEGAVWAYLAFAGGIETPLVLGARATHLRNALGGLEGRVLRAGDRLPLGTAVEGACLRPAVALRGGAIPRGAGSIRLVLGPQQDRFAPEILARLTGTTFTVSPRRDRMAMVLEGALLPAAGGHDIVSDGVVPGSVQVPGSGQPIVLLAESQTTGGYPKIATIAGVDLPRLAQLPAGTPVCFAAITRDVAEELWITEQARLRTLLAGLVPRPEGRLRSDYLLSLDLVGGIATPEEIVPTPHGEEGPSQ